MTQQLQRVKGRKPRKNLRGMINQLKTDRVDTHVKRRRKGPDDWIVPFLDRLHSRDFNEPYLVVDDLLRRKGPIPDALFRAILRLKDYMVVGHFIEMYDKFTDAQLEMLERYTFSHLRRGKDGLLISILIDLANDFGFPIYEKCYTLAADSSTDHLVVVSSIYFLFEHHTARDLVRIVELFRKILNDPSYYQSGQVLACYYLLRITSNPQYLAELEGFLRNRDEVNLTVTRNTNQLDYNHPEYFFYHDDIEKILTSLR